MKRAKRIYILLGVLVVVSAAAVGVIHHQQEQEFIRTSGEVVLDIESDEVQTLSWEYESEELAFHRDDAWIYDGDESFPVDGEKIEELLALFQEFRAAFVIEEVTDYAQYGLDDPVCTIRMSGDGEESWEIALGDYSTMDAQRYVSLGDGKVYLVTTDPLDYFDAGLSDLIDHDDIPQFDQAEALTLEGEDSLQVVREEDSSHTYCSDDVYFRQEGEQLLPLDTSRVDSYLDDISGLDLTDYMTYNASQEDLAVYGLDDPELTVTVDYTDEEGAAGTFTLSVSRDPQERKSAEEETEETEEDEDEDEEEITAYVRVGQSEIVYRIGGSSYEALMECGYDDLRHREVFTADFTSVTGFNITLEGESYTITSEGEGEDRTFFYGEEELETDDLQSALEDLSASEFTSQEPDQKEEISLTVYLDNENFPQVRIELYRYDGERCLAVVDGEPVSLVPRSSVVDLVEAVNAIVL